MNTKAGPIPLRSSAALFTNFVREKHPITRADIIEKIHGARERKEIVEEARAALSSPKPRFAVARRRGKGFHIVGVGEVEAKSLDELKIIAKENGFSHLRMGKKVTKL